MRRGVDDLLAHRQHSGEKKDSEGQEKIAIPLHELHAAFLLNDRRQCNPLDEISE
jgi:hypothetical protein